MNPLERRYRRLLRVYPAAYRQDREEEMVATELQLARPGQRWPRPADVADAVVGSLRCRARMGAGRARVDGFMLAAGLAVGALAGLSLGWLLLDEIYFVWRAPQLGFPITAPAITRLVVYALWVLPLLARLTRRDWAVRVAVVLTVGATAGARAFLAGHPPTYLAAICTLLGATVALAPVGAFRGRGTVPVGAAVVVAVLANLLHGVLPWLGNPPLVAVSPAYAFALPLLGMAAWGSIAGRRWAVAALALTPAWLTLAVTGFVLPVDLVPVVLSLTVAVSLLLTWAVAVAGAALARGRWHWRWRADHSGSDDPGDGGHPDRPPLTG